MLALIDGDIIPYEFGNAKDEDGEILPANLAIARVDERIEKIAKRSNADAYKIYLTGEGNFRESIATILPYKGNRPEEKPRWWKVIRHHLIHNWGAEVIEGMEADDAMSIEQYSVLKNIDENPMLGQSLEETIICSRDKDLNMVPGWHYGWEAGKQKEKEPWWQDPISGLRWFYTQLIIGDSVDNILGLYRVGPKSSAVNALNDYSNEHDMYAHVFKAYQDRLGRYALQFITETARLLWMLRYKGEMWEPPLTIDELRQQHGDWVLDPV